MGIAAPHDLLARIDAIMAELAELRAAVAATAGTIVPPNEDAADLADGNLLDVCAASSRFGYPPDTLRKWAREEGVGRKVGGRWVVSIEKLRARINGRA